MRQRAPRKRREQGDRLPGAGRRWEDITFPPPLLAVTALKAHFCTTPHAPHMSECGGLHGPETSKRRRKPTHFLKIQKSSLPSHAWAACLAHAGKYKDWRKSSRFLEERSLIT